MGRDLPGALTLTHTVESILVRSHSVASVVGVDSPIPQIASFTWLQRFASAQIGTSDELGKGGNVLAVTVEILSHEIKLRDMLDSMKQVKDLVVQSVVPIIRTRKPMSW